MRFVYVKDFAGRPQPEKWDASFAGTREFKKIEIIPPVGLSRPYELPAEESDLSINELAARYPAPAMPEEAV